MTIDVDSTVVQSSGLIASDLDGETVMMSLEQGEYYGMKEVGSRIWSLLAAPICVSDLCSNLMEEYEIDADTCLADVLAFLNELYREKLLLVVDGDPG